MIQTTPEQFDKFVTSCRKWIDYFGLKQWCVLFEHEKCDSNSWAETFVDGIENKIVKIRFNLEPKEDDLKFIDVERTAFHEACELFTWPLEYIGTCRYCGPEEFVAARHDLIRTLENTLFQDVKK
jgi:hypothetical protein